MEPLFFKAENARQTYQDWLQLIGLQWSRFFSKRKIWHPPSRTAGRETLASMEPLFFKAENIPVASNRRKTPL